MNKPIQIPCKTKEEFDHLEEMLKDKIHHSKMVFIFFFHEISILLYLKFNSKSIYKFQIRKFIRMVNKSLPMVKNTLAIIKHCLSRNIALQFNLMKPNEKRIYTLNNTNLYKIIKSKI